MCRVVRLVLGCIAAAVTAAAPEEESRILWNVQHKLGQAQLHETRGELDAAVAKIEEVEAIITGWKSTLTGKIREGVQAAARQGADSQAATQAEPIEFFVNQTHLPENCPYKTQMGSVLKIHYVGKLIDTNKVFASSFHTGSMPVKFTLGANDVVEGWNRGLVDMCTGERRRLLVPYTLAYGANSVKGVPPYSNLRYDIELVEQTPPKDEV